LSGTITRAAAKDAAERLREVRPQEAAQMELRRAGEDTLKVGLFTPLVTPQANRRYLITLGDRSEQLGFHSLWFGEHVVTFDENRSPYPYSSDGKMPKVGEDSGLPEQFTTLAFLAARTERIRLGTGISILPIRNPLLTAKEAGSLDWLTEGRFDFGVGLGWSEDEYEALGVPWRGRGRRCSDYLSLISKLWNEPVTSHDSEFYRVSRARMNPLPTERPEVHGGRIPVYVGGDNPAAFRRVAEFGHGWYAFALTPEEVADRLAQLEPLLQEQGRDPASLDVIVCPYFLPCDQTTVGRYREAGADQVLATVLGADVDQLNRRLDRAAELVEFAAALA